MRNESRANVIAHHVRLAMQHSGLTMRSYAMAVAAHYHDEVPLHARDVPLHATGDAYADERANAQILQRMLDGNTVRLPVSIEESLVHCLPLPFATELKRELAQRMGLLAVPLPRNDNARASVSLGDLCRETGELLHSLAVPLADGRIDADDAPHCRRALKEVRDVQAALAGLENDLVTCMAQANPNPTNVAPLRAGGSKA